MRLKSHPIRTVFHVPETRSVRFTPELCIANTVYIIICRFTRISPQEVVKIMRNNDSIKLLLGVKMALALYFFKIHNIHK